MECERRENYDVITYRCRRKERHDPSLRLPLLVSHNLDRASDRAANIWENAIFLAAGKQSKHHPEGNAVPDVGVR